MQPQITLNPTGQQVTINDPSPTISVLWDRAVQQAVINTKVGPTVSSRAYGMLHTAMFDAWAAYDPVAIATQLGDSLQRPTAENTDANKTEAMSFAAYRTLSDLFPTQISIFDELMADLGFDPGNTTTAAGVGNVSAQALLDFRHQDGANQLDNYVDTTGYTPVNPSPDAMTDIIYWTAEHVPIDNSASPLQKFLTPQWGTVKSFSLASPGEFRPPAPEPFFLVDNATVNFTNKTIALADGSVVPISRDLVGTIINPDFITQAEEVVNYSTNLTDEQKLIAEFWEDGGGTSFPPGTWMTFGEFVSARDDHSLDEDAKLFFTLGNAVFDAGVATWEAKVFYDYTRPVRAIRALGELGLIGEFNADLSGYAIEAWAGPEQGTQTILATDFITYQTPGGPPSPPFAEYTSGHSAFSAAGATVLELLTGTNTFNGSVTFAPGQSRFEPGFTPQTDVTLAWETYSEAADEAGISRLYGGIHFRDGDINSRVLGQQVGASVFEQAQFFITGGEEQVFRFGTRSANRLIGSEVDETFYARGGDDLVSGGYGDDVIYGNDGDDKLRGDHNRHSSIGYVGGNDIIYGGEGSDRISGNTGNDQLLGEAGNDQIWGNQGDDLLRGGAGNDMLTGDDRSSNKGRDTFVIAIGEGTDTITDFKITDDFIGLADELTFGQLTISQIRKHTLLSVGDETLAILKNVNATVLIATANTAFIPV